MLKLNHEEQLVYHYLKDKLNKESLLDDLVNFKKELNFYQDSHNTLCCDKIKIASSLSQQQLNKLVKKVIKEI